MVNGLQLQEPREIHPGIFWIQECVQADRIKDKWTEDPPDWYEPGLEVHLSISAYLLKSDKNLLFDTCSRANSQDVVGKITGILGDEELDYIVVSHGEAPHAGSTGAILEKYPDATLVAVDHNSPEHDMFPLEESLLVKPGDTINLGNFEVEFLEAAFPDTAMTMWMYERVTETLFTVDWLGAPHTVDECVIPADEIEGNITVNRYTEFHGRALPWIEYADSNKTGQMVDYLIEKYDPSIIAPAHGPVVRRDSIQHMEKGKQAMKEVTEQGSFGVFFG